MSTQRVLLIDNEVETRKSLSLALTQAGFDCIDCENGIESILKLLEENKKGMGFHFFIINPFFSDIDGLNLCKMFLKKYPQVPMMLCPKFENFCIEEHPNLTFLEKPLDFSSVIKILQEKTSEKSTLESKVYKKKEEDSGLFSYILVQIKAQKNSNKIYDILSKMEHVVSCEAVRGEFQIVLLIKTSDSQQTEQIIEKLNDWKEIFVVSVLPVNKIAFEPDLESFMQEYRQMLQEEADQRPMEMTNKSYFIIEIEPVLAKNIFVNFFFTDRIISCDSVNKGAKFIVKVYGSSTSQKDKVLEKFKRTEGILRIRQANIIELCTVSRQS